MENSQKTQSPLGPNENFESIRAEAITLLEQIYSRSLKNSDIQQAQKIGEKIISLIFERKDFTSTIREFKNYTPHVYHHPFLVTVFSIMMCKGLEWNTPRTLNSIALGALIHDIGMTTLPEDILSTPIGNMTEDQLKLYRSHPIVGMNLAEEHNEISAGIKQIILQHHEMGNNGFPNKITVTQIYPLAKIVGLADRLTRVILADNLTPVEGLKKFLTQKEEVVHLDTELVKGLIKSFSQS